MFVIDGKDGPVAAIDLRQMPDHISVEHLVGGRRESRRLLAHAAAAARAMGLSELRWPGFRGGRRRVRNGPLQRAGDYLDNLGVPLWHDGTASLPQTLYFRGTWVAVALLIGFGSISIAVFSGDDVDAGAHRHSRPAVRRGVGFRDLPDRPADRRGAARRRAPGVRRDIGRRGRGDRRRRRPGGRSRGAGACGNVDHLHRRRRR